MKITLPLYAQLKENLITAIQRGEFRPGDQLPSQRELCKRHHMSHMTVRRAINELLAEGVIQSIYGKGLYVAERKLPIQDDSLIGFYEHMQQLGRKPSSRVLEAKIVNASSILAGKLQVDIGQPLVYLRRLRLLDGCPVSIATNYLPHSLCRGLLDHDLVNNSLYGTLRDRFGLLLTSSTAIIGAVLADREQAQILDIPLPAALVTEEQITYLSTGQVIDFSRSLTRSDQYYFQVQEVRTSNKSTSRLSVLIDDQ